MVCRRQIHWIDRRSVLAGSLSHFMQTILMRLLSLLLCIITTIPCLAVSAGDWPAYGGNAGGDKFSSLNQINLKNVTKLKAAWTYHTGDAYRPKNGRSTAFEATPLYVDTTVFLATPLGRAIALNPVNGEVRWTFDAKIDRNAGYGDYATRGVSTWKAPNGRRRIYLATIDARLIALDAETGKPCLDFGDKGEINLRNGLRIPPDNPSDYEETSPPAIVGSTVVVGSGVSDNGSVRMPSGEVRAFDAVTGKLKWKWDPIPQDPKAIGANTWKDGSAAKTGAANAWSVIVADPRRDLVFVPTGSASPDYYGGERRGWNLFANSVVALNGETGKMVWYFQTVHHDLWDYDVASPPILFDVRRNGHSIPAIAVGSKTGNLFILNRETGKPIFSVEERSVPQSDVPGEETAATQPFPVLPKPLVPQAKVTPDQAWGPDAADRAWCRAELSKLRSDGIFTPPSISGSFMVPGNIGGMAWGGAAYDPAHRLLIIPVNNFPAEVRLIPRTNFHEERERGRKLGGDWEFAPQLGTPFGIARRFLRGPKGLPCTAPPWGMLTAIDADTAETKWQVSLGQFPFGPDTPKGVVSLGGPLATAGGLVFIAGTLDPHIRAFDVTTGREVWQATLPTSARSSPMTFKGPDGKQYILIAAGGHGVPPPLPPLGDSLVAFRLP
jgi:quinoprotein glucose dehydrogenase